MALPGTPGGGQQISMSQINTELNRSATANISLDAAEGGTYGAINTCSPYYPAANNPATLDEWHGYNHSATCLTAYTLYFYNTGDGYYPGTSSTEACNASYSYTMYGTTSTLQSGTKFYFNANGTGGELSVSSPYVWLKTNGSSFQYTTGTGASNISSCSGTDYYHYYVDSYGCPNCNTITGPANGLVASTSSLTTGLYYYDNETGNVYYLSSYYGFGQYGGQIVNLSGGTSTCAGACTA
jgi:hypothetical protein